MIATTSFASEDVKALVGKDWRVVAPGVIRQGTRLPSDHPIVLRHPTLFMEADDEPGDEAESPQEARGFTERVIRDAVAEVRQQRDGNPTREAVAARLHTSVPTLRRAMKELQMGPWPPSPGKE
jgi:hypothetical protein